MPPVSPIVRMAAQRRTFSILPRIRQAIQSMESYHLPGMPTTVKAAKPDYMRLVRRTVDPLLLYFPWYATMLGWPLAAKWMMDKHVK